VKATILIETSRLILREITPDDADQFYWLNADPEVIRYTGDAPFAGPEEARRFLESYDQYRLYGYGRWAVIRKADQAFLGWCGLRFDPLGGETDLGFRFFKTHWGHGYATEAALASLNLAFERFQLSEVIGRAMESNRASIRVLEKAGMRFRNIDFLDSQSALIYHIHKP
jgi:RimJ/RimL family protein N-acetyltransferase